MMTPLHIIFIAICKLLSCEAKIIGAAIIPHGDFAFAPNLLIKQVGAKRLHTACLSVAEWMMNEMKPDLILLTTPHGLKLDHNFLIYENELEAGSAFIGEDLHDPTVQTQKIGMNISPDKALNEKLIYLLNEYGNNVEGLSSFGRHQSLPLKWAEIIPLKYLQKANENLPKFAVLSFPKIRHRNFIHDLLYLGYSLWHILDDEDITGDMKIMILVSADLAHTHQTLDGKNMPYGYCRCASLYDAAISRWIDTMDRDYLMTNARYHQRRGAKSCGFNGFVLLQGLLDASLEHRDSIRWRSQLLANDHPSYYGMAVGNYTVTRLES